jgi:hypothetical protein
MNINEFRDGVFSLRTRRFGTVAELMIEALNKFHKSKNQFHDRYDEVNKERIEIKFSTVMKENDAKITSENLIEQVFAANISNRAMTSAEANKVSFDCNIQQIKCNEFDTLYYGLFFADKIAIYKMTSAEVKTAVGYSDKQHKGNIGEGQFHINNATKKWHDTNHFVQWLGYDELFNLFHKG